MPRRAARALARLPQQGAWGRSSCRVRTTCNSSCHTEHVGTGECGRAQIVEPGILYGALAKRQALSVPSTGEQRL